MSLYGCIILIATSSSLRRQVSFVKKKDLTWISSKGSHIESEFNGLVKIKPCP